MSNTDTAAQDKATFHGEAETRVEWAYVGRYGVAGGYGKDTAEHFAKIVGGKLVRRTVTTSQWVEVDA